jgi:hypothetical protein
MMFLHYVDFISGLKTILFFRIKPKKALLFQSDIISKKIEEIYGKYFAFYEST